MYNLLITEEGRVEMEIDRFKVVESSIAMRYNKLSHSQHILS